MLAQREAFAVEHGVPTEAVAHAVHFAVQMPAARPGIEQFVLLVAGFEVGHADAGQSHGYAAHEQFTEQFLRGGEQLALAVGWFAEPHRLVRREMVDVTETQTDGTRLRSEEHTSEL